MEQENKYVSPCVSLLSPSQGSQVGGGSGREGMQDSGLKVMVSLEKIIY